MLRRPVLFALVLCLALVDSGRRGEAESEGAEATRESIDLAIERGVAWLQKQQRSNGSFGPCQSGLVLYDGSPNYDTACYETGPTTFALFTLARCGVPRDARVIQRGLAWVRKHLRKAIRSEISPRGHVYSSYESASAILMFSALYDSKRRFPLSSSTGTPPKRSAFEKKDWLLLHACVQHLAGGWSKRGCQNRDGSFGYRRKDKRGDVSATQFALLALRAAERAGYPIHRTAPRVWANALKYLLKVQIQDGSFPYRGGEAWSAGMTAAGVASLLICREQIGLRQQEPPAGLDGSVKKGLAALARAYTPSLNRAGEKKAGMYYHYCYLYAVERVGSLAHRSRLGEKDWYAQGAQWLLSQQIEEGQWEDDSSMGPKEVLGTCFALLFLKRATRPVVTGDPQPK